jgi:hypothetical protein
MPHDAGNARAVGGRVPGGIGIEGEEMKLTQLCLAALFLGIGASVAAAGAGVTLADYERMKGEDRAHLEMMLEAMYETAVYAQSSMDHPALCFTPLPIPGADLVAMVDAEVSNPTGKPDRAYVDDDRLALVLVTALKSQDVCR